MEVLVRLRGEIFIIKSEDEEFLFENPLQAHIENSFKSTQE